MDRPLGIPVDRAGRSSTRRSIVGGTFAIVVVAVAAETYAKWWPYAHKVAATVSTHVIKGSSILSSAGSPGVAPSWHDAWSFTVAYGLDIWPALAAAVLIGAGVEVLLPRTALRRMFAEHGGWRASLVGGVAALPCLMCTCCPSPITVLLRRSHVPVSGALSYWLSNPLLNPVVLILLAFVLPWQYVAVRVVIGVALVFVGAPLVVRLVGKSEDPTFAMPLPAAPPDESRQAPEAVVDARTCGVRYARAVLRLGLYLVPEYVLVVLALGAFRGWLLPLGHGAASWGFGAVVLAAVAGTVLVIPTAAEIPIILGLVVLGLPTDVTGALVVALPALSLASMAMVGRSLSWRVTATTAATVAAASVVAGALVPAL